MTVPPPPGNGRGLSWLNAIRGLTLSNVLVIFLLAVVAVPTFVVYKAVTGDEQLLDRLLSTYREMPSRSGCIIRNVQQRGGPDLWSIGRGFAFMGEARWSVNVLIAHQPDEQEEKTYCESLGLIADKMLAEGGGQ